MALALSVTDAVCLIKEARRQRQAEAALSRQQEVLHYIFLYSYIYTHTCFSLSVCNVYGITGLGRRQLIYVHTHTQQEARGLKNPEAVKAKQQRREEAERQARTTAAQAGGGETAMRVSYIYTPHFTRVRHNIFNI